MYAWQGNKHIPSHQLLNVKVSLKTDTRSPFDSWQQTSICSRSSFVKNVKNKCERFGEMYTLFFPVSAHWFARTCLCAAYRCIPRYVFSFRRLVRPQPGEPPYRQLTAVAFCMLKLTSAVYHRHNYGTAYMKCAGTCSCGRVTGVTHKFVLYMLPVREILVGRVAQSV